VVLPMQRRRRVLVADQTLRTLPSTGRRCAARQFDPTPPLRAARHASRAVCSRLEPLPGSEGCARAPSSQGGCQGPVIAVERGLASPRRRIPNRRGRPGGQGCGVTASAPRRLVSGAGVGLRLHSLREAPRDDGVG
jgi:hypothetical protein